MRAGFNNGWEGSNVLTGEEEGRVMHRLGGVYPVQFHYVEGVGSGLQF